jgi:imidazolonepropionase-like amidohydrolase
MKTRLYASPLMLVIFLGSGIGGVSVESQNKNAPRTGENQITAFIDVTVIPMDTERALPNQTVIVRNGRISEIGSAARIKIPRQALRIDGRGKYLMPGLVDMHTHITDDAVDGTLLACEGGELLLEVANGVTTVRNMKGQPKHLQWRKQVAAGEIPGPTIYTCGPAVLGLQDPQEARRIVLEQAKAGYDCVKVYSPPDWSEEAYKSLIATAKEVGIPAVGHFPRNLSLEIALTTGQVSVDHAEEFLYTYFFKQKGHELDSKLIPDVAKATREAGISVTTTLVTYDYIGLQVGDETFQNLLKKPELKFVPHSIRVLAEDPNVNGYRKKIPPDKFKTMRAILAFQKKVVKGLSDAGVRIMLGTDSSWNLPLVIAGFSVHEELKELVDAGLTPYQALRAATVNPADFLHASAEFGTISVGKRADLILVAGNPLENVNNASRLSGVMLRGEWLPNTELQRSLQGLAAAYATK